MNIFESAISSINMNKERELGLNIFTEGNLKLCTKEKLNKRLEDNFKIF